MHIRVRHETIYRYAAPAKAAIQKLALTPRNHDGQHVLDWRIDVDRDCRLRAGEDAFGNVVHSFSVDGPIETLTTTVEGEVETLDTAGVVRDTLERFPPALYLRETPLTACDDALREFAHATADREQSVLAKLHALLVALHQTLIFDTDATHAQTTAAEAFAHRKGVCQDFAHAFVACARTLDIPSRYVGGYLLRSDGAHDQVAGHAWAEGFVDGLGWVGFDPAHGVSPDEHYVRVAVALDYLGAAPIRGARTGGEGETMEVSVRVVRAQSELQSQT
jgi:transglutaminase-like putative cysteine protease